MTDYSKFPFSVLNRYSSSVLDEHGIMNKTISVNGVQQPTIVPSGQVPELNDSGAVDGDRQTPYIVYAIELEEDKSTPWSEVETLNYVIYGTTVGKVMQTVYCLRDLFNRDSDSAYEVNEFQRLAAPGQDLYFEFLTIGISGVEGPAAPREEGGRYAALLSITYEYSYPVQTTSEGRIGRRQ